MEYRILKSSHYLCNTNKSIANIAIDVGFNGISYYGKIFKKYMGCTPSQYRTRYRK
ncbi:helix-turn-helix domain-containing protein [Clostridium butyricum]